MNMNMISMAPAVEAAVRARHPVVALESTVIAHGLPAPHNVETARDCEAEVRRSGAQPATIGVVEGRAVIGILTKMDLIEMLAARKNKMP